MRQLPFILVLVLSSALLLWNFRRYDAVRAAERAGTGVDVALAGGGAAPADRAGVLPGRTAGDPEGTAAPDLLGAERIAPPGSRVALALPVEPEAELGPALPPDYEPPAPEEERELDLAQADLVDEVLRTPDGRVRAEGKTVNGLKHGRWVEYWGDGRMLSEGAYALGKREGNWTYWHENGQVKERGAYEDDLPDGPWTWHHPDGSLRLSLSYENGKSDGPMREFGPDGNTLREGSFVDGEPDGRWVESHPDGTPRSETHYMNGLRHGPHRAWYSDGQLKEHGEYREGRREGRWLFYDPQGRTDSLRSGYYENGARRQP